MLKINKTLKKMTLRAEGLSIEEIKAETYSLEEFDHIQLGQRKDGVMISSDPTRLNIISPCINLDNLQLSSITTLIIYGIEMKDMPFMWKDLDLKLIEKLSLNFCNLSTPPDELHDMDHLSHIDLR